MTHIVARAPALLLFAAILVLAGCAAPQQPCPVCPAALPRADQAKLQQVAFAQIPGWTNAQLAPGLRAFASACARMAAASALRRTCEDARALRADDEAAARTFVEASFDAWSIASADGAADGLITGYYEPVLSG